MAAEQMAMWVTDVSPLMVVSAAAETPCPAATTEGLALAVGDQVQATIRTPQRPLVTGKVDQS